MRFPANEVLRCRRLPEVVDAEVIRHIAVRNTAYVVDMGRIYEGSGINDEDPSPRMSVGQVVRNGPAADTRADHDVIKIRIRAVVVSNQTGMRLTFFGNQISIVVAKGHFYHCLVPLP